MRNGPTLVVRGTFLGSLVLALLGWFLAGQIKIATSPEVAYAAEPSQATVSSQAQDICQDSASRAARIGE